MWTSFEINAWSSAHSDNSHYIEEPYRPWSGTPHHAAPLSFHDLKAKGLPFSVSAVNTFNTYEVWMHCLSWIDTFILIQSLTHSCLFAQQNWTFRLLYDWYREQRALWVKSWVCYDSNQELTLWDKQQCSLWKHKQRSGVRPHFFPWTCWRVHNSSIFWDNSFTNNGIIRIFSQASYLISPEWFIKVVFKDCSFPKHFWQIM